VRRVAPEGGSATVEFALVFPLVLLVALALLQAGVLMADRLLVANAARAGAREAAVSMDDATVRDAVARAGGLDPARLEVAIERTGGAGTAVSVTVTYRASVAVPLVGWLFPSSLEIADRVAMRQEVDGSTP
jgi:Flp pilus assembly protein TadG